jgi:hypothetical protein
MRRVSIQQDVSVCLKEPVSTGDYLVLGITGRQRMCRCRYFTCSCMNKYSLPPCATQFSRDSRRHAYQHTKRVSTVVMHLPEPQFCDIFPEAFLIYFLHVGQVLKIEALLLPMNILSRLTLHNQGITNSGPLNVVRWRLIFVGPRYGT